MKVAKKENGSALRPRFRSLFDDFWGADKFFEGRWAPSHLFKMPAVNIKDNKKNFEIEVAAPGLTKEDFEVTVDNNIINISCEKEESKESKDDNYTREEFNYSAFSRSFSLPENVDTETVDAKYKEGVLTLTLTKTAIEEPVSKKIRIK